VELVRQRAASCALSFVLFILNRRPAWSTGPYYSVNLQCAMLAVILSGAKNLSLHREILRSTQNDRPTNSFKLDRVLQGELLHWSPDLHGFVHTRGCDARPLRRPCDTVDVAGVTGVGAEYASGERIPDLHSFIIVAGSDAAIVK